VLLVKDEEKRLSRALASIPSGSSVLVIDSESTDRSVAIAREFGATVIVRPFAGFVATRRFALEQVSSEWTFMLDADERLDDVLRGALLEARPAPAIAGYYVSRRTWFAGKPMHGCGWGDEQILRAFRTGRAKVVAKPTSGGTAELHERWQVDGATASLPGRIEHESYPTVGDYFKRFDRYTSIEARGLRPSFSDVARTVLLAPARAVWLFVGREGWRDGWRGAFVSLFSALYRLVATLKAVRP
jgi:glycosyltransferase involved in cell wall biosynthesis